jgi:hypothetical protein
MSTPMTRIHIMFLQVHLRKQFYERFCRLAVEQGDIPKDMEYFVNYVVKWFDTLKEKEVV